MVGETECALQESGEVVAARLWWIYAVLRRLRHPMTAAVLFTLTDGVAERRGAARGQVWPPRGRSDHPAGDTSVVTRTGNIGMMRQLRGSRGTPRGT